MIKTILKNTQTLSMQVFTEDGQLIGSFSGNVSEDAPLGNSSHYINNREMYEGNKTDIQTAYREFLMKLTELTLEY